MKDQVLPRDRRGDQLEHIHPGDILLTLTVSKQVGEDHHVVEDAAVGEQSSALTPDLLLVFGFKAQQDGAGGNLRDSR